LRGPIRNFLKLRGFVACG